MNEGKSDNTTLNFTLSLSLSTPSSKTVSVCFRTVNNNTNPATAGTNYLAVTATTISFAPVETTKTVPVTVYEDGLVEQNERFNGLLSSPSNTSIALGTRVTTIINDDASSGRSINGVSASFPKARNQTI